MNTFKSYFALAALLWGSCTLATAQHQWKNPLQEENNVVRGRAWTEELKDSYGRMPERFKDKVTRGVWGQSTQSAGLSVAFRSDAKEIKVRYVVKGGHAMAHMPATGVTGVDMYATDANGMRRWCAGKYSFGDTISYTYRDLTYDASAGRGYEYRLYLPLYNVVTWLEIGVPEDTKRFSFIPSSQEKPLVVYGTSIAQGACASRPGMAWSNIVERELERPIINLGFSGSGRLEPEMFDALCEIDARLYIIDCMPNLAGQDASLVYERIVPGIEKMRTTTDAPILLVEHSGYMNELTSKATEASYRASNVELRKAYEALTERGIKNLHYLTKEAIGLTLDAMVEGVHPNDLGMRQYADAYIQKIQEILGEDNNATTALFAPRKQQRDPYDWTQRHEEVLKLNKAKAPEIVMIGNSITHFWGGTPIGFNIFGKDSWEGLFAGKEVRNLGFGYDRIENVLWRIRHGELDGYQADKIFMMIGTNNLDSHTNGEIIDGILQLLKEIRLHQPEAKVHIVGILPRTKYEDRIACLNHNLQMQVHSGEATYIDLTSVLTSEDGRIIPSLFRDGLHPNEEGYRKIAEALTKYVK